MPAPINPHPDPGSPKPTAASPTGSVGSSNSELLHAHGTTAMAVESVNGTHPMDADADADHRREQRMTMIDIDMLDGPLNKMGAGAAAAGVSENMVASEALPPAPAARALGRRHRVTYPHQNFVDEPDRNLPHMNLSDYGSDGMESYGTGTQLGREPRRSYDLEGNMTSNISADFSALRTISVSACPGATLYSLLSTLGSRLLGACVPIPRTTRAQRLAAASYPSNLPSPRAPPPANTSR